MMNSILTNNGAMVALQSLDATQASLNSTQNEISTGLKVQTAKDNAAAWTIATTMNANISSLGQVSTNLGNADSVLGTAVSGANSIASLITSIRTAVVSATDPTTNVSAIQNQVDQLMNQITSTINSSSFNGVNLLNGSVSSSISNGDTGVSFLAATANSYAGGTGVTSTIEVDTKNSNLSTTNSTGTVAATGAMGNLFNLVDSLGTGGAYSGTNASGSAISGTATSGLAGMVAEISSNPSTLNSFLKTIDTASQTVEAAAAQFGAVQQNVEAQQTFVNNLSNTLTSGVSNLVDADMSQASAQLSALQTQQQLGVQALSIANQAPQMILKLFGG